MTTYVFTDGACLGNPGPGGWAYLVDGGPWASGAEGATTNQRMELTAVLEAVRALPGPLEVHSDSAYVVNCFAQGWWKGWMSRGWLNSQKKPVANRDLWEPLIELVTGRGDVTFTWVKAHAGHRLNDAADRLATTAAAEQAGRAGDAFDDSVTAGLDADEPVVRPTAPPRAAADVVDEPGQLPFPAAGPTDGHLIAVFGHRPPELGGYGENPILSGVRRQLIEILRAKRELYPDVVVATGLGLGAEMLAAEAAAAAGVPFVAVLAFDGIDAKWPNSTRRRFAELVRGARNVVTVSGEAPKNPAEFGKAMGRRDDWLLRNAAEAIIVRNPDDRTLGDLSRRAERALGDEVWTLEPPPSK